MGNLFGYQLMSTYVDHREPERIDSRHASHHIFLPEDCVLAPRSMKIIPTGIKFIVPERHFLLLTNTDRNSLLGIEVSTAVIHPTDFHAAYVVLHNHTDQEALLKRNQKVAQALLVPYNHAALMVFEPSVPLPRVTEVGRTRCNIATPNP